MLQAALSESATPAPSSYRRATGASRDGAAAAAGRASSFNVDAAAERPSMESLRPLPAVKIRDMVQPIVTLIGEMSTYTVMGASTQVVAVDMDSTLSVAFIAATESRVSSVLLWDSAKSTFGGVLTVTDYIRILLHCNDENEDSADVASLSIRELVTKPWLKSKKPATSNFIWGTPNLTVLDCLRCMRASGINRLPILASKAFEEEVVDVAAVEHGVRPSTTADSSWACPPPPPSYSVVSVLTLTQLLAHLGRVLLTLSPLQDSTAEGSGLFDVPLGSLGVGRNMFAIRDGVIPVVHRSNTVADVLRVLIHNSVNAVCVSDENTGAILDVLTRSDVLRMESGGSYDVTLTLHDALSWRPAQRNAVVCCPTDTFGDVLAHFVNTWVKEMFVVDPVTDKVLGQLSMKEMLYFLIDAASSSPSDT